MIVKYKFSMSTTEQHPDFSGTTFAEVWALMKANEQKNEREHKKFRRESRKKMRDWEEKFEWEKAEYQAKREKENADYQAKFEQEKAERLASWEKVEKSMAHVNESVAHVNESVAHVNESVAKTEKSLAKANKAIGRLGNRFGEAMERLVRPGVADKFNELGYDFPCEYHGIKIKDPETKRVLTELDVVLENGESVIVVEIKVNPCNADIEHLAEQLQYYREFRNQLNPNDHKKIFGAIAAAVFPEPVQKIALGLGYYVIVPSGENIKIVVPEKGELKAF
jgi:hypothetical protein